jgi:hypothetical protein
MRAAAPLALLLIACTPSHPPVPPPATSAGPTVPRQLRRLSNNEIDAVASDLLGHEANLADGLLQEPRVEGFDDDAQSLLVSGPKLDDFVSVAETVAAQATTPGCTEQACALDYAAALALKAYGRPLDDDERTRLGAVYAAGGDHQTGVQLMVEAMLLSPYTIYRTELGGPNAKYELASELSFLVTGSRPDAELLAAAADDSLFDADARVQQAQRLMATDRGKLHVRDLMVSWLDLHDMEQVAKLLANFGFFTRPVRTQMRQEIEAYLDDSLYGSDGTLKGLFTASRGFPGPLEAAYYGDDLEGTIGNFQPVAFDTTRRRGVISLPGYLAHHAAIDHTAPVQRGLFVRTRFFCQQIAPPPPNAQNNPPDPGDTTKTNRDKYKAHSADPFCYGCHRQMDPIGFGFENFDTLGRHQTTDNGFPVDSSGTLEFTDVDGDFNGPAELALKLGDSAEVRRCFLQNMWRATAGRELLLPVDDQVAPEEKITQVLLDIVRTDGFVRRDTEVQP